MGRVMARSTVTRVVTLRNVLSDKNVEFMWSDTHPLVSAGIVSFLPKHGVVAPGDFVLLRVRLTANCNPLVINNCFELRLKDHPIVKVSCTGIYHNTHRAAGTACSLEPFLPYGVPCPDVCLSVCPCAAVCPD